MLPLNKITEIFQRLVMEDVSIRNFKLILDSMLETAQKEKDVVIITEYVRRSLGRYISYKFSDSSYVFSAIITNRSIEDVLRNAIRFSENGSSSTIMILIFSRIERRMGRELTRSRTLSSVIMPPNRGTSGTSSDNT